MASATQQTELATGSGNRGDTVRSAAIMEHIVCFGNRLTGVFNYDSFEYECLEMMQRTIIGERQAHTCSYDLCIGEGINLGEIIVSRATPFRESELQVFETCLSDLCLQLHSITRS